MAKKPSKKSVAYWWREAYGEVRSRHVLLVPTAWPTMRRRQPDDV